MATLPKSSRKHTKGQDDHIDAWLMSYADLITLLFIFFVIFVSVSMSKHDDGSSLARGEPVHPYIEKHFGLLPLGMPYDNIYSNLKGVVIAHSEDKTIAVEKTDRSVSVDVSALSYFTPGTADIPAEQLSVLQALAHAIKDGVSIGDIIEVQGHTDDVVLTDSKFANNWELAAMRATRMTTLLIDAGIDPAQIRAVSYAGNRPIVPNEDEAGNAIPENRLHNQRVVIKVEHLVSPPAGATQNTVPSDGE